MKKHSIPVILLKNMVLLPSNTLKLEFENSTNENNVIDMSLLFHDGYILVASEIDNKISDIAVLSKIENKIELPNGNTRIDINGLRREKVIKFMNLNVKNEPLEAIIQELEKENINAEKEKIIINKLIKELKNYSKNIPYISNSVINVIEKETSLSKIVDIVVPTLSSTQNKLIDYLNNLSTIDRSEMLLKDIYKDRCIFKIERNLDLKVKQEIDKTQQEYFLREKMKLIKEELGDVVTKETEIDKLKRQTENLNCNEKIKKRLLLEINRYSSIPSMSPELNITKDYIDWLLNLPWNIFTKDNDSLKDAKEILDKSHYGLKDIKQRIIEYLAVKKNTNSLNGPIICLAGPPGVGKTSLAKTISECLNRKFIKISVNGITDEAEIIGHRKTYVGSSPGRIISSIKKCGSSNPVILIDEIDKMGSDYKSDPVNSLLTILDPEQNKTFTDNYIEEEFDLSNVMFILTANNIEDIKGPLKDRLEIIDISGYTEFEKIDIAKKHLLPKILKLNGIDDNYVTVTDKALKKIIRNYTKESGVRELNRQLDKIIRKIVTQIVINNIKVNKIVIDDKVIEKYLGHVKYTYNRLYKSQIGIVNGLAYTPYGGDVLPIEINYYKGDGKLILTGSLGDVMKESATIALSYIKSNYKLFNINYDLLKNNDIHIHVPEGAIKKEGPSAGIALTLCLISALTNKKIPNDIALTGEITLRGKVLAIGGLKEKSIGALQAGIKKIIIPYDNMKDLDSIPNEVKDNIQFIPVKDFKKVVDYINE
jgi:ATP-dependent Lon protease